MTDTLTLAAILIPSLIIAIVFHEVAHGYAAYALGDPTAKDNKRLSLNPLRHVDPIGTLLVPGLLALASGPIFGWAKPVPVRHDRLDNPRYGMMAVAAAGPGMNFVLAGLGAIVLGVAGATTGGLAPEGGNLFQEGLLYLILINVFLGMFNLLPVPPFDGSHIVGGLLPDGLRFQWYKLQRIGMLLLLAVIAASWVFGTGWIQTVIWPPVGWVMDRYLTIASMIAG